MRFLPLPLLLITLTLQAQTPVLDLRAGAVTASTLRSGQGPLPLASGETRSGRIHRFLVFNHVLDKAERQRIEAQGVRFLDALNGGAWTVSLPADIDRNTLMAAGATGILAPDASVKLDPALGSALEGAGWRRRSNAVTVMPWSDLGSDALERVPVLTGRPFEPLGTEGGRILQVTGRELKRLLSHPAVQWVAPAPVDGEPEDLRGRTFHRVNPLGDVPGGIPGLDGAGVTVVVNDDGFVGPHIDFQGRTVQTTVAQDLLGDHGDMVAGIVGGAGNVDPRNPGMAPGSRIIVRQYQSSLPNTVTLFQNEDAVIFNSSYSDGCNGGYTNTTRQVDLETVANPALIQVFSAGNNGGQDCGYGAGAVWGNITGGHKIAKNCIAVANLTDNDVLVGSSSRGPSADGRLKPDVSAYGQGQISTDPDHTYAAGGGTSAASPGVAGTLAVLYQGWRARFGSDPSSGLMKAVLMNTADDLGNTGPDHTFGWGRVNAARAWRAIEDERFQSGSVDQGQQQVHTVEVPPGMDELRVMLYWMDPAASLQASAVLVNDLDLLGSAPDLSVHRPWEIPNAPNAAVLASPAVPGEDHVNNVEQVAVYAPASGTWTFTVSGGSVPDGPQAYFLVHEFLRRAPHITYPIAGDVLATNEPHRLRWDALPGTSTFDLAWSTDSGATWTTLPTANADRRHYDLNLGATITTDGLLRVTRDGLTAIAGPFATMPVATGLQVTFNCVDSAGLTWDPVPQATGYILHRLGAQYMDSVGFTTGTAYTYTGLQAVHADWFAVTAIGPEGVRARRSLALPRPQQLIDCQADRDLTVSAVLSPAPLVLQCQPDPTCSIRVRNAGLQAVNSFTVGRRVNNGAVVTQSVNQTLLPGDSTVVTFTGPLTGLPNSTTSTLRAWATSSNETFTPNDTLAVALFSTINGTVLPFLEDGEGLAVCATSAICDLDCGTTGLLTNGRNGTDDDIDWRVDTAGTSTSNTGPSADHTLGTPAGRYFYLEASGNCDARRADLYTPCVTLPAQGTHALSFWYHLFGATQGALHVDLIVDGQLVEDAIAPLTGDQGDQWRQGSVSLAAYAGSTVTGRFRGITGSGAQSDMALDDIGFAPATSVAENNARPSLQLRPTEDDGVFVLVLDEATDRDAVVRVFDATGRRVRDLRPGVGNMVRIDLADAAGGVYIVRLEQRGQARQGLVVRP
jgi:hypothetical protein